MTDEVKAEQIDREAAAALARWTFPNTVGAGEGILEGHHDTQENVQAFVRHRLAEREAIVALVRNWNGPTRDGDTNLIADAIEAGQHLQEQSR